MVVSSKRNRVGRARRASPASRDDFLDTLRFLGARLSVPHEHRNGTTRYDVQPVALRCTRRAWERALGTLGNVTSRYVPLRREVVHTWQHSWNGGRVTCMGYLDDRADGTGYVVVTCAIFCDSARQPRSRTDCQSVPQSPT